MSPASSPVAGGLSLVTGVPSKPAGNSMRTAQPVDPRLALDLPGDLGEEARSAGRRQGLGAETVHDLHVVVHVVAVVQVQSAGELLDVHDILQLRFGETQHGERASRGGMPATAERYYLNGDLRKRGYLDEAVQLRPQHPPPAHRPPQRR